MTKLNAAPAWSPELSPQLRDALATAERAATEAARIDAVIAAARDQFTAAGAELECTRVALATAESESALAGGPADRQARKSLIAARDEADFLAARLTGLEARRQTASSALIDARRTVAIAWRNWQRAQAADYIDRVYIPALDQFVAAIRGVTAAATASATTASTPSPATPCSAIPLTPSATTPTRAAPTGRLTPSPARSTKASATSPPPSARTSKASRTPPPSRRPAMPRSFDERLRASFDPLQGRRLLDQIETGVRPTARHRRVIAVLQLRLSTNERREKQNDRIRLG